MVYFFGQTAGQNFHTILYTLFSAISNWKQRENENNVCEDKEKPDSPTEKAD